MGGILYLPENAWDLPENLGSLPWARCWDVVGDDPSRMTSWMRPLLLRTEIAPLLRLMASQVNG